MRIVYVNTPAYDYLTATLIEGLNELGHELVCTEASNYGRALPDDKVLALAESADLIVVGSNAGVRHHLLQGVSNPRLIFVDGGDGAQFDVPPSLRFKAVFKRELCREDRAVGPNHAVFPLPFAAERRYFTPPVAKDILVSFIATLRTNPLRNSIHVRLQNQNNPAIVSGSTSERSYSVGQPRPLPIGTPNYHQILARSLISVSVPGMGWDCARFWEILAARAMLLTFTPDIVIPDGFKDGIDYATFASLDEFESKLKFYTAKPERAQKVAAKGHERLLAHHTTAHRAAYFLDHALAAAKRPDYCARFVHPELRALEGLCQGIGIDLGGKGVRTTASCRPVDDEARGERLEGIADASLDFVVARHDLQRHADPTRTLAEWARVLRPGGKLGLVLLTPGIAPPSAVDPTFRHTIAPDELRKLAAVAGGLTVASITPAIPDWSFAAVLVKGGA